MGCPTKVGDSALLRLFNGGSWCGVSPLKCFKYYMPVGELYYSHIGLGYSS